MGNHNSIDWQALGLADGRTEAETPGHIVDLESMVEDIRLNAGPAAADAYLNAFMSAMQ